MEGEEKQYYDLVTCSSLPFLVLILTHVPSRLSRKPQTFSVDWPKKKVFRHFLLPFEKHLTVDIGMVGQNYSLVLTLIMRLRQMCDSRKLCPDFMEVPLS